MNTLIINAQFDDPVIAGNFADTIQDMLGKLNMTLSFSGNEGFKCVLAQPSSAVEKVPEVPAQDIEVAIVTTAVDDVPAATPEAAPFKGEMILKSLSSDNIIPFEVDTSLKSSVLKIKNLKVDKDILEFVYCGIIYKFPVEKSSSGSELVNKDPIFTDTSIRTIAAIAGVEKDPMPILLNLEDGGTETYSVVLAQDLADIAAPVMEKPLETLSSE
jgi:midasin (ATPase involved in ribosome maturation)